eukprot:8053417-Pyramimonas_sp.AAC.1
MSGASVLVTENATTAVTYPVGAVRRQILRLTRWFRSLLNPSRSSVHHHLQFLSRLPSADPRDGAELARRGGGDPMLHRVWLTE